MTLVCVNLMRRGNQNIEIHLHRAPSLFVCAVLKSIMRREVSFFLCGGAQNNTRGSSTPVPPLA